MRNDFTKFYQQKKQILAERKQNKRNYRGNNS